MKKSIPFLSMLLAFVFCFFSGIVVHAYPRFTPDTRYKNVTAFARVTPDDFARKFNQYVTKYQYENSMYVGTPIYDRGEYRIASNPQHAGDTHVRVYLAVDDNGYINWVSIPTPVHFSVCTEKHELALQKIVTCAASAVMSDVSEDFGGRAIRGFNLRWRVTQTNEFTGMGVVVFKRMWGEDDAMLIDLMHIGPMGS